MPGKTTGQNTVLGVLMKLTFFGVINVGNVNTAMRSLETERDKK